MTCGPDPPRCRVEGDRGHRTAAPQIRLAAVEPVPAPDQDPGAERRVGLVTGERQIVDTVEGDADAPVGYELGAVDGEARAVAVRDRREPAERQRLPGHVARARDREERSPPRAEFLIHPPERLLDGLARADDARCVAHPGQEVGVMLDVENDGLARNDGGQQVERVRGVAREHDEVVLARAHEVADHLACVLVCGRRHLGQVPGAAVHAGVEREHIGDVGGDRGERRRARRVVQVDRPRRSAVDQRHLLSGADDRQQRQESGLVHANAHRPRYSAIDSASATLFRISGRDRATARSMRSWRSRLVTDPLVKSESFA